MTVITYLDELKDKKDKDEAFDQASWATGSSSERTYFIANYVHVDTEQSFEVDRTALDILDSVLLSAESFIRISKQREKKRMEREAAAGGNIFRNLKGSLRRQRGQQQQKRGKTNGLWAEQYAFLHARYTS